ncbi:MAG: hypothetical protein JJU10_05965 [Idiomarina sp.]|nr:hypothetical protein [Idiomarina sp.]
MNYSSLNKRLRHPGLWGHEGEQTTAQAETLNAASSEQVWATISSMRHQDNQWVTVIGKPSMTFLRQLESAGISKTRIRCINPQDADTAVWATEQALLLNNSQLIIAWLGNCSPRDQKRLALAARNSQSIHFVFTEPTKNPPLH